MINLSSWAWPQITYAILLLISAGLNLASHGKEREPYNFWVWLISAIIGVSLLLFGGFFA